jgi:hypothetical protein
MDEELKPDETAEEIRAWNAAATAAMALLEASERNTFEIMLSDPADSDRELDEWTSDTAAYGSLVFAGDPPDIQRCQRFWEWWCREAVRQAWTNGSELRLRIDSSIMP